MSYATLAEQTDHYANVRMRLRLSAFEASRPGRRLQVVSMTEVPPEPEALPHIGVPVNLLAAPSWKIIVRLVALRHGLTSEDIFGPSRRKHIVRARHAAIYLVKLHFPKLSTVELGKRFGGRDHSSIIHALRNIDPTFSTVTTQSKRWQIDKKKALNSATVRAPYAGKFDTFEA
jgi:hypothetical protein